MKPYFLAFFLLFSFSLSAQKRIYLDKNMTEVDSISGYEFYLEVLTQKDGLIYLKKFKKDGNPVSQGAFSRDAQTFALLEEGVHRYFYENRKPWYQVEFKNGKREGMLASWYPSGASKRVEYFKNDASAGGECFGEDGKPIAFTPFWQAPQYLKGQEALERFLASHIKYPEVAYNYRMEATILVNLYISNTGNVLSANAQPHISTIFLKEAARVASMLEGWKPGLIDDIEQTHYEVIPVRFRLTDPMATSTPAPEEQDFNLIKAYIDSEYRFYINALRNLVSADQPYVYQAEVKAMPNGKLHIIHYDNEGFVSKKGIYSVYNSMLEIMDQSEALADSSHSNLMASGDAIWQYDYTTKIMSKPGGNWVQETETIGPEFVGAEKQLYRFLQLNLNYPKEAKDKGIQGSVLVEFIVDKAGNVSNLFILKDIGGGCGQESLRVLNMMPRWIPGKVNGQPVKVRCILEVRYLIE